MRDRIEKLFAAWGALTYRHAWLVIGASLLLAGGLGTQIPGLRMDTSTEGFFHEEDPVRIAYDEFRHQFGQDSRILVTVRPPKVFDLGFLERLRELHEAIETEVPRLVEVTSLVNARETRGEGDELIVGELMEEWPTDEAELAAIEKRALANPLYVDNLISADGDFTAILIETEAFSRPETSDELGGFGDESALDGGEELPFISGDENKEIIDALLPVLDRYRAPGFEIYATGTPLLMEQLQTAMQRDMARFTLLCLGAIIVFLAALFRRTAGVVLPVFTVLISLVTTLSLMALTGLPITTPTSIIPSFLLAVGVGGAVHILAIFYQARRRGEDKGPAISFAMGHSGLAVAMTSLTTSGGLLSFLAAELRPIAHLGIFAPVGIMVTLLFTLTLLPALVAVFPMRDERARATGAPSRTQRWLMSIGDVSTRNAGRVAAAWFALLAVSFVGIAQVEFSHNPFHWFKPGHPLREANELVNDEMRGSMFVELVMDTHEENGLHEPALLHSLEDLSKRTESIEVNDLTVGKTFSLADVIQEIHQALNENRSDFYVVPDDRRLIAQELLLFENSGSDDLEDFVDSRFSRGHMTFKIPFEDAVRYPPLFREMMEHAEATVGQHAEISFTGMGILVGETLTAVIHTLARSYIIAFVIITPLMILLIGSVRLGLVAMIPNLTPIAITLGIMGWFGLPLDAFTLMIGGIAIGLAVDDTIHFMHNFRRYHSRTGDVPQAVRETLATTGQALLFTSIVLSTGFALYMLASMQNLFYFGMLTAITIIMAFLADLIFAPALMILFVRRPEEAVAPLEMEAS